MADYTYAAAPERKKLWEETLAEETARANAAAEQTKQQITDANEQYKAGVNAAYDTAIQTAEGTAKQNADAASRSYQKQFDANAAQQMAADRNLREQMANLGLTQSGYNATNQTALQVARANADAGTRTARQAAVDSIMQELAKYRGEMNTQRAQTLTNADLNATNSIIQAQQDAAIRAESNAMGLYQNELSSDIHITDANRQNDFNAQKYNDQKAIEKAQLDLQTKNYVDKHNADVYALILSAYNSGNTALAEEYAKDLWQINPDGTIGYKSFDSTTLSQPAPSQPAPSQPTDTVVKIGSVPQDELLRLRGYMDSYYSAMAKGEKTADVYKEAALKQAFRAESLGMFATGDELALFLYYAGIPEADYEAYRKANMPRGVVLNENNTHYQTTK